MSNTSATGGVLLPNPLPTPVEDDELDAVFQKLVVGLTGIEGSLVRPRWQPVPPKQPEPQVNWCALGITVQTHDAGPAIAHDPDGDGRDTYERHQEIEVLCTFYGPRAKGHAQQLVDGLAMPQNQEPLNPFAMRFISAGSVRAAPDLVNQQWVRRQDVQLRFRRKVARSYAVLSLEAAAVTTAATTSTTTTEVSP